MEPFSLLKWFQGFNIFKPSKLAKLAFFAIIVIVGIGIYHKIFVAKTTSVHVAKGATYNAAPEPVRDTVKIGVGCNMLRGYTELIAGVHSK